MVPRPDSTYPLILKPYKLDLTQFGDKIRDEVSFKIENVSDQELEVSLVAGYEKYFDLKLPKSIGAGKTGEATLKLTKAGIEEGFEKSFTIQVNDEQNSRFTMPVKRTIRPSSSTTDAAHSSATGH